jgi:outer membrane receptor for ferrienterochelin and colicins
VKILKVLVALFLFFPALSAAQQIKVTGETGVPVPQAVVIMRSLSTGFETALITDNKGIASASALSGKVLVTVQHLSFQFYADTLTSLPNQLTINLKSRDVKLSEVVVTSEYTARTTGESIHPVVVINRSQIDGQAAANLSQVLEQQLNMRVANDQVLGQGLTLNGLSGQNIKFLVDGVPVVGRLDGNIDISQLNLNNVERIEVVNGPMAASYGTDASGGVINLITRQSVENKYQFGLNLMHETTGHYNADLLTGYNTGKSSILISGGRNFFDGWSQADTGRWQEWKPKEQYFGNVKYRWTGKKMILGYQLNGFHETISNKGNPRVSPYFAYAFDEYYKTIRLTNQLNNTYLINANSSVNAILSHSWYHRAKNTYRKDMVSLNETIVPGVEQQDTTVLNSFMVRAAYTNSRRSAVGSRQSISDSQQSVGSNLSYQAGIDFNVETADGSRFNDEEIISGDYAVFASAEYKMNEKLEIKPAVRIAHNTDYKAPVIPSLMLKYDFTKSLSARLSYGKGFRAPGLKERYLYFVDINHNIRGNENLLPEYSDNFFLNLSKRFDTKQTVITADLNGFYNDVRNMITLAQPDLTSSLYTYINLGKFSTHGGSLSLNAIYGKLTVGTGFAYTGRYNIYADSGDFNQFIYSPDLNAKAQYEFTKAGLTASVFFKLNGKLPGYRLNPDNTISQFDNESYKFMDVSLRKSFFGKTLFIAAGVKNIFDVTRISAIAQGTAHSAGSDQLSVGTGRSYFVKLQYSIGR